MDGEQYTLNDLRDIVIPDPPAFWPPAPGMWVALGIVVAIALLVGWRLYETRKCNAYRKAGLRLLYGARSAHDVAVVMKRVALAAFPREQVASLTGNEWAAFLHATCPRSDFSTMITTEADTEPDQALIDLAQGLDQAPSCSCRPNACLRALR